MITENKDKFIILMADDDEDDIFITREAFGKLQYDTEFKTVCNGKELLAYLRREGKFQDTEQAPFPSLILLDLNMPIVDGREALRTIKLDPIFKTIPVIALTTSSSEQDIKTTYDLGINSYIVKPVSASSMHEIADTIAKYWIHIVRTVSIRKERMKP